MSDPSTFSSGDSTFTVTGGSGSVSCNDSDINAAAGRIHAVADQLAPLAAAVRDQGNWLQDQTLGQPQYPNAAIESMRLAADSCGSSVARILALGDQAITAARNYENAEANSEAAARADSAAALQTGIHSGLSGLTDWKRVVAELSQLREDINKNGLRDITEKILRESPAFMAGLLGPQTVRAYLSEQALYPEETTDGIWLTDALRSGLEKAGLSTPGDLSVQQLPPNQWAAAPVGGDGTMAADGSMTGTMKPTYHDLLAGSQEAYAVAPSSIIVRKVVRADGTAAWMVDMPGTEQWLPLDPNNVWSVDGDMQALTSADREKFEQKQVQVEVMVRDALKQVGATSADPVILTGHSGGGIQAAAMASDSDFLKDVNVRMVVMAGSPAANQQIAPGIDVMDLQNTNDIVPALDMRASPETPNWVTVTSHRPGDDAVGNPKTTALDAHDLGAYLGDAFAIDSSDDPTMVAAGAKLASTLGVAAVGTIKFQQYVFQGVDLNSTKAAVTEQKPLAPKVQPSKRSPKPSLTRPKAAPVPQ